MMTVTGEDGMNDEAPLSAPDAKGLRFLRRLVTVLTATMILGVLTIVLLLVIRLQTPRPPLFPDTIALPEGTTATAITRGEGWIGVVTDDNRILIYPPEGGTPTQDIAIEIP